MVTTAPTAFSSYRETMRTKDTQTASTDDAGQGASPAAPVKIRCGDDDGHVQPPPCCWICYQPAVADRPLLTPCKCRGTIGQVHEDCLLKWIQQSKKSTCMQCGQAYNQTNYYTSVGWCILDNLTIHGIRCTKLFALVSLLCLFLLFHMCVYYVCLQHSVEPALYNYLLPLEVKLFAMLMMGLYLILVVSKSSLPTWLQGHVEHTSVQEVLDDATDVYNIASPEIVHYLCAYTFQTYLDIIESVVQRNIDTHRRIKVFSFKKT